MGFVNLSAGKILKKIFILLLIASMSITVIACKKEIAVKKAPPLIVEEEDPYEKIEDISDDDFDNLTTQVRDQVMVFDIVEVHDEIFPTLKTSVDIDNSDQKIEEQIELIVEPFMDEWTRNRIRDYLTNELGEVSESDVERFKDKINNKQLIDFIVVYEKNFLKGKK